jgi:hypothetical protein
MTKVKGVLQQGCSVYSLNGFPPDYATEWDANVFVKLQKELDRIKDSKRGYVLSLNGAQTKARKMLEAAGFKILGVTYTAHIDWAEEQIEKWKKDFATGKLNNDTIYLMGRGFWTIKRRKK